MLSRFKKRILYLVLKLHVFLFGKLNRISFEIAKTSRELDKVYRLRWEVYIKEKGYGDPRNFPNKKLKDEYDEYSVNFLATKNNKAVGAVRLVLGSKLGLPIESYFNIIQPRGVERKNLVEASRLVIVPKWRGGMRIVMIGLGIMLYEYSKKHNINYWYASLPRKLADSFKKYGLSFKRLKIKSPTRKHLKALASHTYFEKVEYINIFFDLSKT